MIKIYKDYKEFYHREDKTTNGVTQKFLDDENITLDNINLINCTKCWNCIDCIDCIDCRNCIYCWKCIYCIDCRDCIYCRNWTNNKF